MAGCFIMFAFSHYESLESVLQYAFSPKYCVLTASIFAPENVKNIHKQGECGIYPVLLTDHAALRGENQIVKLNYFLSLLRERLSV